MKTRVTPFLWLNDDAEAAATLYTTLLPRSRVVAVRRRGEGGPAQPRAVMAVDVVLDGLPVTLFNGGPHYTLSPAFSLSVDADQREVDRLWLALTKDGGAVSRCGWLVDRFGVSWQLIPRGFAALMADPGAMQAMLTMKKLDLHALRAAATNPALRSPPAKKPAKKKPTKKPAKTPTKKTTAKKPTKKAAKKKPATAKARSA